MVCSKKLAANISIILLRDLDIHIPLALTLSTSGVGGQKTSDGIRQEDLHDLTLLSTRRWKISSCGYRSET